MWSPLWSPWCGEEPGGSFQLRKQSASVDSRELCGWRNRFEKNQIAEAKQTLADTWLFCCKNLTLDWESSYLQNPNKRTYPWTGFLGSFIKKLLSPKHSETKWKIFKGKKRSWENNWDRITLFKGLHLSPTEKTQELSQQGWRKTGKHVSWGIRR